MTENNPPHADSYALRFLPLLLILFAGSGCSALIYEIVWYQLLQFVIGSTAISLGVLLATFMGGLCLGSIALSRALAVRKVHPLRIFGVLELGIGLCAILALFGMPLVGRIYVAGMGHGLPAILWRAIISSVCLLPNNPDGRITSGHCAVDRANPPRDFLDGIPVQREHDRLQCQSTASEACRNRTAASDEGHVLGCLARAATSQTS